jgi:hypothetical protein
LQVHHRRTVGSGTAGHLWLLAESTFWRPIFDVHLPRMPLPPCVFCILDTHTTESSFSVVGNAPVSPISPQWATAGTARRAVSRSCALGLNGERAALCRSSREACTREHTSVSWGCLPITRQFETKARATPENTDQSSIVPICGGNAEIDSLSRVVGQFVDSRTPASQGSTRSWLK